MISYVQYYMFNTVIFKFLKLMHHFTVKFKNSAFEKTPLKYIGLKMYGAKKLMQFLSIMKQSLN